MAGIRLELLGGLEIRAASGAPLPVAARKVRALLVYLALAPARAHSRGKLAALLWGDSGEEQARTSLRQALATLRKAVSPQSLVVADADTVMLAADGWSCDALAFAQLAAQASAAALGQAADLYRGDLLEGFYARAPAFDEWLTVERERLRVLAQQVLLRLLDHHAERGAHDQARGIAARLLALDPLREEVHRTLMRLYLKQGRQAAALKQYRLCRAALQRELGVSPEAETERLHREILQLRRPAADAPGESGEDSPIMPEPTRSPAVPTPAPRADAAPVGMPRPAEAPESSGSPGSAPELRESVVLVADLDGFAAWAETADPEQVHAILSCYRERINGCVAQHGGVLVSHVGARAMAVFGTPRAHGNEAERAVRAALAVRDALASLATAAAGSPAVRVALASGQILTTRDELGLAVSGEPVGMAARIVESAAPGEVWLSHRVRQSLAERLDAEAVAPSAPVGERPMSVWRAQRWLGQAGAQASVPLVGRAPELRQLGGLLESCLGGGPGQVIVLRGDAGIGKSRLAEELVRLARGREFDSHRALVFDFGGGADPISALFASLLGCAAGDDAGERSGALDAAVADGRLEPTLRAFACDLLDLPQSSESGANFEAMDDAARKRGRRAALAQLARHAAGERPLLMTVEDVHWAEPATVDDLAALAAALRDRAAILLMTTRSEGDPLDGAWRAATGGCRLATIDLGPLGTAEGLALANHYGLADEAFVRACVTRAEGNPLFLDQLLRAAGCSPGFVPGSLQGLVLARLDRLEPADRRTLQAAAVLGQRFSLAAVHHLAGTPAGCARLIEQGLVRGEGDDFLFVHALIHEAVYASLLKSRRQAWHRQAAAWFAARDPELAARHLDAADDPGAAAAYLHAAQTDAARHRHDSALRCAERGLDLAAEPDLQYELVALRADLLRELGDAAASVDAFDQAVTLAQTDPQRCRAWLGVAAGLRILDRYGEALAALDHAEAAAQGPACTEALAQIHGMRGNIHFPLGNVDACLAAHEQARQWAARCGAPVHEAQAVGGLGDAWYQRGHMRTARALFERCVALAREHGLRRLEVAMLPMLSITSLYCLELPAALAHARGAIDAASAIGDLRSLMLAHVVAASVEPTCGDRGGEREHAERALQLARRLGARRFEAEALATCAWARLGAGQREEARALLASAQALSRTVGDSYFGPIIRGWAALAADDAGGRRAALAGGEALLAQGCVSHCHLHFYQTAMDASLGIGDWDAAERYAAALAAYTAAEPLPWADFLIRRARALALAGRTGGAAPARRALHALRAEAAAVGMLGALPALDAALDGTPPQRVRAAQAGK